MQPETTARRRARTSGIMRSAQRTFIILGAIVLFALGIAAGLYAREWWNGPTTDAAINPTPTSSPLVGVAPIPTSAPVRQESFLIVLVDSLDLGRPALEGAWLVTFDRGSASYFLMGFDREQKVSEGRTLREFYDYETTADLSTRRDLTALAIQKLNGGQPIKFSVVLDRALLADLIDVVGGLVLNDEWLDGTTFLARYGSTAANSEPLDIEFQQKLATTMLSAFQQQAWQAGDMQTFFVAHQDRYSLPPDLLVYALEALPLNENEFVVQLNPR